MKRHTRILIIEDEEQIADTLKLTAEVCKIHDVTWAPTIEQARHEFSLRRFDIVFWDDDLGSVRTTDGFLQEMLSQHQHTLHVAMSGDNALLQMEQGCRINLAKPFGFYDVQKILVPTPVGTEVEAVAA